MLALPASSLAQSAGSDQYQDPLAGHTGGGHTGSSGSGHTGSSGSSSSGGGGSSPASATPPASASGTTGGSAGTGTTQANAARSGKGQLPRTGFDVILTIEMGLALLLTGVVAQRTIVLRDRRNN
jgi:hypothetical protein